MMPEITDLELSASDLRDLRVAKSKLETRDLVAAVADVVGKPTQALLKRLPKRWHAMIGKATQAALFKGLGFVILTLGNTRPQASRDRLHKMLATTSGMIGGAAGITSSLIELPVSTCLVLRSIADIARSEGHDITRLETKLACLEVLALSGQSANDEDQSNWGEIVGTWRTAVPPEIASPDRASRFTSRQLHISAGGRVAATRNRSGWPAPRRP
jgi:hypothetical protein